MCVTCPKAGIHSVRNKNGYVDSRFFIQTVEIFDSAVGLDDRELLSKIRKHPDMIPEQWSPAYANKKKEEQMCNLKLF